MNCPRTANVRSITFVELCALSRDVFKEVAGRYTTDRLAMEKHILERYNNKGGRIKGEGIEGASLLRKEHDNVLDEDRKQAESNQKRIIDLLELIAEKLDPDDDNEDDNDESDSGPSVPSTPRRRRSNSLGLLSVDDLAAAMRENSKKESPPKKHSKDKRRKSSLKTLGDVIASVSSGLTRKSVDSSESSTSTPAISVVRERPPVRRQHSDISDLERELRRIHPPAD